MRAMRKKRQNRLAQASSPYLQQHAHNPVDWYPWCEEALQRAKQENKPILLSIGYAACHWCHVMAHESFEDKKTADSMNAHFINIKVDREERPDLDKIYQTAFQLLNQRAGGWPLTVFLTPDQVPFLAGTYFPKVARGQMPAFQKVLTYAIELFTDARHGVEQQNISLLAAMRHRSAVDSEITLTTTPVIKAQEALAMDFDGEHGGFTQAPKFPHPTYIELLLRPGDGATTQQMATDTLIKMAAGGIYDQLGGGFFRYSVDERWEIPHFEKMLYDNAQLLCQYAYAYALTKNQQFSAIVSATTDWVLKDMQAKRGGYYSTISADSEGQEGKFYVWQRDDIKKLLSPDEYKVAERFYNLQADANFEGCWHLHSVNSVEKVATTLKCSTDEINKRITSIKQKLLSVREKRIRPERDEKILTSWNALMIKGMALAGYVLQRDDLVQSAESAVEFIENNLWINDRLRANYKDGKAQLAAYLDDYAFLIDGLLTLLQIRWRSETLQFVIKVADALLAHFSDPEGGFYFTADDHEQLIYRPMVFYDEALPSGYAVAVSVLTRLGYLLGNNDYLQAADKALRRAWELLQRYPEMHSSLVTALEDFLNPPEMVVMRGEAAALQPWRQVTLDNFAVRRLCFAIPNDATLLPAALAEKKAVGGPVAYICQGDHCQAPINNIELFSDEIHNR